MKDADKRRVQEKPEQYYPQTMFHNLEQKSFTLQSSVKLIQPPGQPQGTERQ